MASEEVVDEELRKAFHGLLYNLFTIHLKEIHENDLSTLKIKEPKVYETIEGIKVRKALVKSGFFKVAKWKSPKAEEDLEIEFKDIYGRDRLLYELSNTANFYIKSGEKLVQGKEAVKTFLKSLFEITKAEWSAWNQNKNDLKKIRSALAKEANLSKSKIESLLRRIRVDSPLLTTWNKVSKRLE